MTNAQEVPVSGPKFVQDDRKTYTVHRPCGHCRGTGRRRADRHMGILNANESDCSQCRLQRCVRGKMATNHGFTVVWGIEIDLFAFELTEDEYEALEGETKMGAYCEIIQHGDNAHIARILCEQAEQDSKAEVIFRVRHFA
jgi:hypothetical protein